MQNPFYGTAGPRDAKILLCAEAWGAEEEKHQTPLCGQSGREMFRMLGEAFKIEPQLLTSALSQRKMEDWLRLRDQWLAKASILLCNVIAKRPLANDFTHFLLDNKTAKASRSHDYDGVYPNLSLWRAINHLWDLIDIVNPKLIIACGNWPLHILTPHGDPKTTKGYKLPTGIATWRGSQTYCRAKRPAGPPMPEFAQSLASRDKLIPCLPIIHPAAILRDWSLRHVTVHDLRARAGRFINQHVAWEAPPSDAISAPNFYQVIQLLDSWLTLCHANPLWLCADIETYVKSYITCVGLCDDKISLCIPFFYFDSNQRSVAYWSIEQEQLIWRKLKLLLEHPNCRIIGQNFIYDTQYFSRYYCIDAIVSGDTTVAHHLLFPGTPKSLARLASLYNNHYCYWKDESEEWAANEHSAEELWRYNCKDVRSTYEAWFVLQSLLVKFGFWDKYETRLSAWKIARKITIKGVAYDNTLRNQYLSDLSHETSKLEAWLLSCVPPTLRFSSSGKPWFSSPSATMFLLYHVIGLKPILHKKTKKPTSDDAAINELLEREDCEWLAPMLKGLQDLRSALVSSRNFLSVKLDLGRLTSQFNISQPETFRWSSKENAFNEGGTMQNIPKIED